MTKYYSAPEIETIIEQLADTNNHLDANQFKQALVKSDTVEVDKDKLMLQVTPNQLELWYRWANKRHGDLTFDWQDVMHRYNDEYRQKLYNQIVDLTAFTNAVLVPEMQKLHPQNESNHDDEH